MNFGKALEALKLGKSVAREGWNGMGMRLRLYKPMHDEGIVMVGDDGKGRWYQCAPYIGLKTVDDKFVPWQPSQTDMLAEDWTEVA